MTNQALAESASSLARTIITSSDVKLGPLFTLGDFINSCFRSMAYVREIDGYTGIDVFDCERNLVARLKEAYLHEELSAFLDAVNQIPVFIGAISLPDYDTTRGDNSITYLLDFNMSGSQPLSNETSGEHVRAGIQNIRSLCEYVYLIGISAEERKVFHALSYDNQCARINTIAPPFLQQLFQDSEDLAHAQRELRDNIMRSDGYIQVMEQNRELLAITRQPDLPLLRKPYRQGEFRYRAEAVELCRRAEDILVRASEFYHALMSQMEIYPTF